MSGENVTGGEPERNNGDELQLRKGKVKKMKKDRPSMVARDADSVQEFFDHGKKGSEIDKDLGSKNAKEERKKAKGDIFPTQTTEASASLPVESKEPAGNEQQSKVSERIEKRKRKERDENSRRKIAKQSSSTGDSGEVSDGGESSVSAVIGKKGKRKKKSKYVETNGTEPSSGAKAIGNEQESKVSELIEKRKRKEGDENSRRKRAKQSSSTSDSGEVSAGGESSGSAVIDKKGKRKKKSKEVGTDGMEPSSGAKAVGKTSRAGKEKCSDDSELSKSSKKPSRSRRVSFSGNVEVFPPNDSSDSEDNGVNQVRGKRFSLEEDELVKKAVLDYINTNQLGDDGLKMVLNCRKHPKVLNCWKEIGLALPWRPYVAVYYRAHTLFERSEERKWEPEEYGILRRFHEEHGPDWKTLAKVLGKDRKHVKDAWRRIKLPNLKRGNWSQEEYQILFDLVNLDLRMKSFEEKKTKHGMLRDNISWEAISQKMSTRYVAACCVKWYEQLTSPLVNQGLWVDTDDYRMLDVLRNSDACCVEDVDWDNLLEHRSGEICRKRWDQMTRHIGGHREKSFIEQVEVLSKRFCPEMLEYRS